MAGAISHPLVIWPAPVSPAAKLLYLYLADVHEHPPGAPVDASHLGLAGHLRMPPDQIARALLELVERDLIIMKIEVVR